MFYSQKPSCRNANKPRTAHRSRLSPVSFVHQAVKLAETEGVTGLGGYARHRFGLWRVECPGSPGFVACLDHSVPSIVSDMMDSRLRSAKEPPSFFSMGGGAVPPALVQKITKNFPNAIP